MVRRTISSSPSIHSLPQLRTRLARHFLRRDINLVDVLLLCNMVNKYSCEPALDLEEVEQIVYLVCGEELMELSEWE